jgi:hypothetical protein
MTQGVFGSRAPLATLALLALAALTGSAQAQVSSAQQSAIRANCRSDFMSHCSGVTPGGQDALICLQKNVAGLSPACRNAVSATMPPPAATKAATTTPPATMKPPAVASAPPAAVAPPPQPPKARLANAVVMLRACKRDLLRDCRGVEPGGGRELACLAAHQSSLSFRCKIALKVSSPLR